MIPPKRKWSAGTVGIVTGLVAFVVIIGGAFVVVGLGLGPPWSQNAEQRAEQLTKGAALLSFWIGLITFGIVRARRRRKGGGR